MPRFVNARTTVCATCWSTPVSICGSASRIVTSAPTSTRNDANSQPIAPPPMTATRAGTSVELRARGRTTARASPSNVEAVDGERAATSRSRSSTLRPRISVPSETRIDAAVGRRALPVPGDDRDLAALQQRLEPLGEPVDDALLAGLRGRRARAWAPRSATPNSAAPRTVRSTSAVCSSSLAGMQPRCRQVPPTRCSSTIAMFMPAARAVERGGVAARSATEDDEVEVVRHASSSIGSLEYAVCAFIGSRGSTWKANATRITKPVSAARTMYVRVLTRHGVGALEFGPNDAFRTRRG